MGTPADRVRDLEPLELELDRAAVSPDDTVPASDDDLALLRRNWQTPPRPAAMPPVPAAFVSPALPRPPESRPPAPGPSEPLNLEPLDLPRHFRPPGPRRRPSNARQRRRFPRPPVAPPAVPPVAEVERPAEPLAPDDIADEIVAESVSASELDEPAIAESDLDEPLDLDVIAEEPADHEIDLAEVAEEPAVEISAEAPAVKELVELDEFIPDPDAPGRRRVSRNAGRCGYRCAAARSRCAENRRIDRGRADRCC